MDINNPIDVARKSLTLHFPEMDPRVIEDLATNPESRDSFMARMTMTVKTATEVMSRMVGKPSTQIDQGDLVLMVAVDRMIRGLLRDEACEKYDMTDEVKRLLADHRDVLVVVAESALNLNDLIEEVIRNHEDH